MNGDVVPITSPVTEEIIKMVVKKGLKVMLVCGQYWLVVGDAPVNEHMTSMHRKSNPVNFREK